MTWLTCLVWHSVGVLLQSTVRPGQGNLGPVYGKVCGGALRPPTMTTKNAWKRHLGSCSSARCSALDWWSVGRFHTLLFIGWSAVSTVLGTKDVWTISFLSCTGNWRHMAVQLCWELKTYGCLAVSAVLETKGVWCSAVSAVLGTKGVWWSSVSAVLRTEDVWMFSCLSCAVN